MSLPLDGPLDSLMTEARAIRDAAHGTRVTYSPKVFIPLTMLCRDRCGYCTFAQPPARLDAAVPRPRRRCCAIARAGAALGCHEALFTLGEAPRGALPRRPPSGWPSTATPRTVDYLVAMCQLVLDETGLLPHANAGALSPTSSPRLRAVSPVAGDDDRDARRAATWRPATAARPTRRPSAASPRSRPPASWPIPFTTGILVGIGETRADRIDALEAIADVAPPPRPRAGGDRPELPAQARHRACTTSRRARPTSYLEAIAAGPARPPGRTIHLQAPPNLSRRLRRRCSTPASTTGAASPPSPPTT